MTAEDGDVVVSALAVVSPLGIGTGPFTAAVRAGRSGDGGPVTGLDADPDFAPTRQVRLYERASALAVGTVAKLLAGGRLAAVPAGRRGIVLGSGLASIDTFMGVSTASLTGARPYHVDHKRVPAAVMNYTSAQAAIKFDLRGPNVTVTAGRVSGLTALGYGKRLLDAGRAGAVVSGSFDELTPRRLAIEAAAGRASSAPAEGCCVFLLESARAARDAGRTPLAEVLSCTAGLFPAPDEAADVLAGVAGRALERAGVRADDVRLAVPGGPAGGPLADREAEVLKRLVPGVRTADPGAVVGDTAGAAAGFQAAAALALPAAGLTLLTALDPDGQVGCAVLRVA